MQDLLSRLVGAFSFIGCLFAVTVLVAADTETFETASSVEEVRRQIEKLPKDTSWWNVNGKDMAWNNKNLNRIFPTVSGDRALFEITAARLLANLAEHSTPRSAI